MKIITTDEDIDELPLPTLDFEGKIQLPKSLGRTTGKTIGLLEKELIAVHSNLGTNQTVLANAVGVSQAEVSIIERGIDRTNIDDRKDNEHIKLIGQQAKHKIVDLATTKLMDSLEMFQPGALEQKDLPGAAAKLAVVAEKISGNNSANIQNNQFIIYQPRPRSESDYGDVIILENERS